MTQMLLHRIRIAGKTIETYHLRRGSADPENIAWWREPLARRDWEGYLWRVPRPGRLAVLLEIAPDLTDAGYWRLLGTIWTDTEMPNVNRALWLTLFISRNLPSPLSSPAVPARRAGGMASGDRT